MRVWEYLDDVATDKVSNGRKTLVLDDVIHPYKNGGVQLVFVCLNEVGKSVKKPFSNLVTQEEVLKDYINWFCNEDVDDVRSFDLSKFKESIGTEIYAIVKRTSNKKYVNILKIIKRLN